MSSLLYPANLPGITFGRTRTPRYATEVQSRISGKESRLSFRPYPTWKFQLKYEWLDDRIAASHLRALQGLFMAMKGRFDSFLYTDPHFNSVAAFQFGTGDTLRTQWPLIANFRNSGGPGGDELVQNFNGVPLIYRNGTLQTSGAHYTLGPTGIVTFASPPGAPDTLTWTGSFYYRCRFSEDEMTFEEFLHRWWQTRTVSFESFLL